MTGPLVPADRQAVAVIHIGCGGAVAVVAADRLLDVPLLREMPASEVSLTVVTSGQGWAAGGRRSWCGCWIGLEEQADG